CSAPRTIRKRARTERRVRTTREHDGAGERRLGGISMRIIRFFAPSGRRLAFGETSGFSLFFFLGSFLVGCAAKDTGDGAAASDDLAASSALEDHVEVAPDRLVFDGAVARSADLTALTARVRTFEARRATPSANEQDVAPVILVGRRQANAV